ncbi:MAG: hypothetical protein APR54_06340 [Candidatus Cloacimonas sp. SDB]|nr:MAG: hypothetical protein APR54_06340 [Candidatus Cloacimonas sp. SDB]
MNGDGYEELGYYSSYTDSITLISYYKANILLGNNECDSLVDYTYDFPSSEFSCFHKPNLKWLGDINNDGYDDAGLVVAKRMDNGDNKEYIYLIFGNNFELQYFCTLGFTNTAINGIGDHNDDGFSDFIIGYYENESVKKLLFNGGIENDSIPDMILTDIAQNPYYDTTGGIPVGDWNGDGIDDFNGGVDGFGPDIWINSDTIPLQFMHLDFNDWLVNRNNDYGDVNGDGKDDFACGNSGGMSGLNGNTYLFLGGQNGTFDYSIQGVHGVGLGWSVAIGDFNNDGFSDLATGGRGDNSSGLEDCWCGKVYVYAGNGNLIEMDPNIGVYEDIISDKEVIFNAYPNPFNPSINFEIQFTEEYDNSLEIQIYNIRGQIIKKIEIENYGLGLNKYFWYTDNEATGIYFCKLVDIIDKKTLLKKKVTLMK